MIKSMTPAERTKAVYRGERPDKVPFTIYESKVVGKPFEEKVRSRNVCLIRRVVSWHTVMPHVKSKRVTEVLPNGHRYQKAILETPFGCLSNAEEKAEGIDIDTTWKKERLFKNADDYKKLRFLYQDMIILDNYNMIADSVQLDNEKNDLIVRDTVGSEPMQELISDVMGVEKFCYEWMDNRDEIEKLLTIMSERAMEKARIVAASPLNMANYGGNVTPQVIGREAYIKHYMARYAEAYDLLHQSGKIMGVHLDGANEPIMDLIAQSKMDYVEAYDPSMSPSVREAMHTFRNKVLSINWPSAMQLGSRDQIMKVTIDILSQVNDFSRFIMGVTEDIPNWKFAENIHAIADAIEHWDHLH